MNLVVFVLLLGAIVVFDFWLIFRIPNLKLGSEEVLIKKSLSGIGVDQALLSPAGLGGYLYLTNQRLVWRRRRFPPLLFSSANQDFSLQDIEFVRAPQAQVGGLRDWLVPGDLASRMQNACLDVSVLGHHIYLAPFTSALWLLNTFKRDWAIEIEAARTGAGSVARLEPSSVVVPPAGTRQRNSNSNSCY